MDLPHSIFLYLLLLVALALGYLFGRRERKAGTTGSARTEQVIQDYYRGLNFLLEERPELGVDRFIQATEVADDSIDVHLALAGLVRRRGEVDKAIRIHQNLLASPALSRSHKQLVEFELARDFHAAGLLDRAEGLLADIVKRRDAQYEQALALLVDLLEQQKDWGRAIELLQSKRSGNKNDGDLTLRLSHFYCELAQAHLDLQAWQSAADALRQAKRVDSRNPRAHLLSAHLDVHHKKHKAVTRHLQRALELDPDLVLDVVDLFEKSTLARGADNTYLEFLQGQLERSPEPALLERWMTFNRQRRAEVDYAQVLDYIAAAPDEGHIPVLLALQNQVPGSMRKGVDELLATVATRRGGYRCSNCGFTSHARLWHCPTCKRWGTYGPAGQIAQR